jgi:glycosyltransferase involved in cell wall biosynthesis
MLAGCIPVVSDRGSLPEVVGDCGIVLHDCRPQAIAEAIRTALGAATQERLAARNRILSAFPMGKRDTALANAVTGQDSTNNRHLHCA